MLDDLVGLKRHHLRCLPCWVLCLERLDIQDRPVYLQAFPSKTVYSDECYFSALGAAR